MPRKTSISLSDEDDAIVRAQMDQGVSLRDLIRRGAGVERPDLTVARQAAAEALEALKPDLEEWIGAAVKRAFAKAQGGSW